MDHSLKNKILRCVILMLGLIIAHLGVTLYLLVDLGADPFNVLVQGIFRQLGKLWSHTLLTHGNVHIVLNLLIILVLLLVDRSYIRIGTVLCMVFGGPIIDGFTALLAPLFAGGLSLWLRLLVAVMACAILALGMSIVIKSEAGTGPNDLVAVVLADKLRFKFSIVRVVTDASFVAIGFLLGGSLGIGTIICAFLVGPIAGIFLPHSEKYIHKLLHR